MPADGPFTSQNDEREKEACMNFSAISHQIPSPDFDAIRAMPAEQAADL